MKFFFKILSLSIFALLLPITVYSVISHLFTKDDTSKIASKYSFIANAEFGDPGGAGEGIESAACESAAQGASAQGCQGEGGEGK